MHDDDEPDAEEEPRSEILSLDQNPRNFIPRQPSVSEVDGSEFFDQESFDELEEEELGTKGDWDADDEFIDILMY